MFCSSLVGVTAARRPKTPQESRSSHGRHGLDTDLDAKHTQSSSESARPASWPWGRFLQSSSSGAWSLGNQLEAVGAAVAAVSLHRGKKNSEQRAAPHRNCAEYGILLNLDTILHIFLSSHVILHIFHILICNILHTKCRVCQLMTYMTDSGFRLIFSHESAYYFA